MTVIELSYTLDKNPVVLLVCLFVLEMKSAFNLTKVKVADVPRVGCIVDWHWVDGVSDHISRVGSCILLTDFCFIQ